MVWSGETEFRFVDVQVQTDMMARGGTGSAGRSHLAGQVLRDGAPFGRFVSQAGRAFLEIGSRQVALDLGLPG